MAAISEEIEGVLRHTGTNPIPVRGTNRQLTMEDRNDYCNSIHDQLRPSQLKRTDRNFFW